MLIKYLYAIFIGILFATFIGVGIATFYEPPKPVDYRPPEEPYDAAKPATESAQIRAYRLEYEKNQQKWQDQHRLYSRNVSIMALTFAVTALIISLTLIKNLQIISDGLLLGGIFTLVYSIIWGFQTEDNKFRFIVVTIGFIISVILGYIKFVKHQPPQPKNQSAA